MAIRTITNTELLNIVKILNHDVHIMERRQTVDFTYHLTLSNYLFGFIKSTAIKYYEYRMQLTVILVSNLGLSSSIIENDTNILALALGTY